jgi:PAS domain S-box-containing protein
MLGLIKVPILFSILSFISGCLMLSLSFYIWKKHWVIRKVPAARSTVILMLLATMWLFGFIFQLNLQSEEAIKFLEYFLYIGPVLIGPTWLILALQWTGRYRWLTKNKIILLYIIPIVFLLLIFTNDFHSLIFRDITFLKQNSILIMSPVETEIWWLFTSYVYALILIGVSILVRGLITLRHVYRKQAVVLLIGTLSPFFANIFYNFYLIDIIHFDFTPISFIVSGFVYYWGFSKFKLIEIVPVARDAVFDDMQDLVFVLDSDDRIVDANPILMKTFGLEGKDIIGEKFEDVFVNQKQIIDNLKKGKEMKTEVAVRSEKGKEVYDMQIDSLVDNHGNNTGYLVSLRDITKRKEMEEELRELNIDLELKVRKRTAEIEKLLKQKDDFIWQLSHDLKSPLTPILGLLPTIKEDEKDPKLKELLEVIDRNAKYMKDLVTKTLEFERLGSPNANLNFENIDLSNVVDDVLLNKKTIFSDKQINIENNMADKILVSADKIQLNELFDNLLTNAIKFTPDKGKIKIDAEKEKDDVIISVSDTGIGLDKEQVEHIFDEFYKVDESRHELDSSGLGLPICKRIVEKHKGEIWVESAGKGKGTTFYIKLPKV